jgi:hypothetical protein
MSSMSVDSASSFKTVFGKLIKNLIVIGQTISHG